MSESKTKNKRVSYDNIEDVRDVLADMLDEYTSADGLVMPSTLRRARKATRDAGTYKTDDKAER